MTLIRRLSTTEDAFREQLDALLAWESVSDESVHQTVRDIITDVRKRGDEAVLDYTARFDRLQLASMQDAILTHEDLSASLARIPTERRQALEAAAARVRAYAEKQKMSSWQYTEADGTVLGQQVAP